MKQTLLELTQSILSAMDSDEVTSINDTVESMQVAILLRDVYYDLAVDLKLPEHDGIIGLTGSSDTSKPLLVTIPENVSKIESILYDCSYATDLSISYGEIKHIPFQEFMRRMRMEMYSTLHVGSEDIIEGGGSVIPVQDHSVTINGATYKFVYRTDKMPEFYTHINSQYLLFDSLDLTEDSTIQTSKIVATGHYYPTFELSDSFVPSLDASQFSYYRNKAKVRAFNELKQTVNQEAMMETRRQKITIQSNRQRTFDGAAIFDAPRYGRK